MCGACGKKYASAQIMKQHEKVSHNAGHPQVDEVFVCPHCQKAYNVKKSMWEHTGVCPQNPNRKGPYFCRLEGFPWAHHAFQCIKSLNIHVRCTWLERKQGVVGAWSPVSFYPSPVSLCLSAYPFVCHYALLFCVLTMCMFFLLKLVTCVQNPDACIYVMFLAVVTW